MVWYGMVVYQKDGKTCEGSPLSAYKHITRLFPYYFPIISLVVPYYIPYFPSFPLLFPIVSIIYLLFPS